MSRMSGHFFDPVSPSKLYGIAARLELPTPCPILDPARPSQLSHPYADQSLAARFITCPPSNLQGWCSHAVIDTNMTLSPG